MKNIIIIGSNSVIARDFFLHQQRINKNNFLRISRRAYDNPSNSNHILYDFSRPYDVMSYQNLLSKIRSFLDPSLDTVICLFAWSGTPRTSADLSLSDSIRRDNLNIINNLLYLVNDLDVSQSIFLSTAGGIYNNNEISAHNELSPPNPATPYGFQKLDAESTLVNISDKNNIPLCIYRVSCAYGFNQYCPDQGVLNKWIFDGLQRGEINIYNSLDSELNFISYHQISHAFDLGINLCLNGIFNLCSSSSVSLMHIHNLVTNKIPNLKSNILGTSKRVLNVDGSTFRAVSGCEFPSTIDEDFQYLYSTIYNTVKNHS